MIDFLEEDDQDVDPEELVYQDPDEFFAKNAFRIIYQTNNFLLPQLRDLIERGEVMNLRPEYQRRLRWNNVQKSKLIESLLLNIPIPPVFLYEKDAARYEVMDGQQRLNTVREFLDGEFKLFGLKVLHPLNGLVYSKCPPRIKRALDRASLSAIVLLLESERSRTGSDMTMGQIRRLIFDRLNTGGTKLNPQEIRNALNPGEFNSFVLKATRLKIFTDIFGIPAYTETVEGEYYENPIRQRNILYSSMKDCELVIRYYAIKNENNIRGAMRSMLDRAMEQKMSEEESSQELIRYEERLIFLNTLFNQKPFELPVGEKGAKKISMALYDASMVAVDKLWLIKDSILAKKDKINEHLNAALADPEKYKILTGKGNTANSIRERVELMLEIFQKV